MKKLMYEMIDRYLILLCEDTSPGTIGSTKEEKKAMRKGYWRKKTMLTKTMTPKEKLNLAIRAAKNRSKAINKSHDIDFKTPASKANKIINTASNRINRASIDQQLAASGVVYKNETTGD